MKAVSEKQQESGRAKFAFGNVNRTIAALVVITLLPSLLLLGGLYWVWYSTRLAETAEANLKLSRAVAATFEAYIRDVSRQQHTLGTALGLLHDPSFEEHTRLLMASREQYPVVRAIHWVRRDGVIVASSDPRAVGISVEEEGFYDTLWREGAPLVSDLLISPITEEPVFLVGRRTEGPQGEPTGALLTTVRAEALGRHVLDIELAPLDAILLFDPTGAIVFSNVPDWMGWTPTVRQDPALYEALAGREGSGRMGPPDGEARRLVARVPIEGMDWVAGAGVSLSGVAAPLLYNVIMVTVVFMGVVALAAGLAVLISRRITKPLDALHRHAHLIGAGKLDQRVEVHGLAELEDLANAFNRMSAQVAASQNRLERINSDLRRSNRDLEEFAYIASHDLQEPLRAVAGFATLLQQRYEGKLDEKADSYIQALTEGAARMQTLINGLLDYSRVGTKGKAPEPVRADDALGEALANLQVPIEQSGAAIHSDRLPTVHADKTQITHLFQNLIGNAIKFRSERPPEIHVGSRRENGRWLFWVRDNGIGIDPQYAERVFTIFQRLHTRNKYPGTGIGLAICRRIVERHGGNIWVESQPGQGSTFYFTLPEKGAHS